MLANQAIVQIHVVIGQPPSAASARPTLRHLCILGVVISGRCDLNAQGIAMQVMGRSLMHPFLVVNSQGGPSTLMVGTSLGANDVLNRRGQRRGI